MFNYFVWEIKTIENKTFLMNNFFWFQVLYKWNKTKWSFFLYPYRDQNLHTYIYFCFDNIKSKNLFEKLIKLPGIWPKNAFNIATIPEEKLKKIIDETNIKLLTQIPGIWPKTAKRIIIELKDQISKIDEEFLKENEEIVNKIVSTLTNLWYESKTIKKLLKTCPIKLEEKNLSNIIKRILDNL